MSQVFPPARLKAQRHAVGVTHTGHAWCGRHALGKPRAELLPLLQAIPVGIEIELVEQNVIRIEAGIDAQRGLKAAAQRAPRQPARQVPAQPLRPRAPCAGDCGFRPRRCVRRRSCASSGSGGLLAMPARARLPQTTRIQSAVANPRTARLGRVSIGDRQSTRPAAADSAARGPATALPRRRAPRRQASASGSRSAPGARCASALRPAPAVR